MGERPEDPRRALPSVDALLRADAGRAAIERWGREVAADAVRAVLEELRLGGEPEPEATDPQRLWRRAAAHLAEAGRPSLRPVLNATGVVLHTNLGRAPLAAEAIDAVVAASRGYADLEYRLADGRRGDRYDHCVARIRRLTGAEAAVVVNNAAAGVALCVHELARDREVVVSRGELVEIGGSFRLPEVVRSAGGRLVEVGTTNRTRIDDYRRAITDRTGAVLRVHPSNFTIEGFAESPALEELGALCAGREVPLVWDLGSGPPLPGLPPAPDPAGPAAAAADLVVWSGDKLLGGPQAGIVHGRAPLVARLRRNPLLRALRVGKLTLAALEATLRLHEDPERARRAIPVLRMLTEPAAEVSRRARLALDAHPELSGRVGRRELRALVGGGAYPGIELPSAGWGVSTDDAEALAARCRAGEPPLLGRVEGGELLLDFRTLLPGQEGQAAAVLATALRAP